MRLDENQVPILEDGTPDYDTLTHIVIRVARSFLFFVYKFCWIENKDMSGERIGETRFKLWPSQRPIPALFLKHRLLAILKARQLGLTWLTAAFCLWRCITKRGFLCVVISAKEEWATEFMDRVRFMYNRLPEYLKPALAKDGSEHMRFVYEWDKDGKKPLVFSDIKSLTTTPEGAQSKTPDLLVMDETARNRYAREIFGASKPGIDKAGGQIIVISNSHKRGPGWPWTRAICSAALRGENSFHFLFMPWWDCPERLTQEEAKSLSLNPEYVPAKFKSQQLKDGVDPVDVSENYPDTPQEALSTIHGSYFGETLSRHTPHTFTGLIGTLYRDRKDGELYYEVKEEKQLVGKGPFVFELWRYPYFLTREWNGEYYSSRYAMGSDVSEGQGRSYSVAYVIDRLHDEFVCRIRSNRIDAVDWAKFLWLTSLYYTNFTVHSAGKSFTLKKEPAMICVEKTGAGLTSVKELEKVSANQFVRTLHGKRGDSTTDDLGWHEDRQAKHILCGDLKQWFRTSRGRVYCSVLLDEAATTIEHENGGIGPEKGELWDTVVGAGCAIQASLQMGGPPQVLRAKDYVNVGGINKSNWGV